VALTANILSQTSVSCYGGSNGSISVAGWGGTPPYAYSLNGGSFGSSGTFSSLSAGIDTITVRDAAMDLFDLIFTTTEPEILNISVSGEDITCYGAATGSATASVSGGIAPYSYLWDTTPAQTAATAVGLTAGTYTVTITDANGCSDSNSTTILQPAVDMTVSITGINVLCNGGESGSATAEVEGGLAPYEFSWNTVPEQTKETATDLSAGNYTVTVTDSHGCIKSGSIGITEPEELLLIPTTTPNSCPDSNDGAINLAITGGRSPYNIIWSDGSTAQNRTNLIAGEYSVIITDQNACAISAVIEVDFTWTFNCVVIPQVITPNNDGFNDEWIIKNIDLYPNAEVRVFNRWGEMVFSTKNLSDNPWNGRMDGKLVPTDSYHYILYLNDGSEPRSGVISVIR
jgi:gliding motility-associated-like protein